MHVHHIGVITKNIENSIKKIKKQHEIHDISNIIFDPNQNARLCMLYTNEGLDIELIEGEDFNNMFIKGTTYYHICYSTNNINEEILKLTSAGAIIVKKPLNANLFDMKKVAFLYSETGLIELLEKN